MSLVTRLKADRTAAAEHPFELPNGCSADDLFPAELAGLIVSCDPDVRDGWLYDGSTFVAPPPPVLPPMPVPEEISDRQFAHGLWKQGVITLPEAKAFVTVGEMPAALAALLNHLPADQRDDADLLISGSTTFHRHHPLTSVLAAAFGWHDDTTDAFWRFAAAL